MPKARSEHRDKALEIYLKHDGDITNRKIAEILDVSEKTVSGWKSKDKWPKRVNGVLQSDERSTPKKPGAQPGNKNGKGGKPGNQNARKHGLFSKYLPPETLDIIDEMPLSPLDILWDQIQIAYAALIRAQKIMYVEDKKDKTIERIEEKHGNVSGEKWEVQQAWDKHSTFLQAQSRAQKTLEGMISKYEDMLHRDWDLASDEQKARVEQIKAQTSKINSADGQVTIEDKVAKLFEAIGGELDAES